MLPAAMRGKARVARYLLGNVTGVGSMLIRERNGLLVEVPSIYEAVGWHLLIDGVYEPAEQNLMRSLLGDFGCMIDIGANIGAHALPLARKYPSMTVLAVEASQSIRNVLNGNVARNRLEANVRVIGCAAGAAEGDAHFLDAQASEFGRGMLSNPKSGTSIVQVRTLDSIVAEALCGPVQLIKVDVEGYEAAVFRGAKCLLGAETKPWVLFEFHADAERDSGEQVGAAQQILLDYGYRLYRLTPHDGQLHALDYPLCSGFTTLLAGGLHNADDRLLSLGLKTG